MALIAEDIKNAAKLFSTDLIIAVIGPTGSGKSNIIDTFTNQPGKRAGSRLESYTTEVRAVRLFNHPVHGDRLVLVDTPGFDNTNKSDLEILQMVSAWLQKVYEKNIKLTGLIYLHRITDNRMAGSPHRNLRMFGELCGDQAAKKVVLVTTMWDKVQQDIGVRREKELFENYWKTMISYGASTARFSNSAESAWKFIDPILNLKQPAAEVLLLQELVDLKRPLSETKAGKALYSDKQKLLAEHRDTVRSLAEEAREQNNLQLAQNLEAELKRVQKDFEETFNETKELKIHRRLSAAYRRWQGGFAKPVMTDDLSPDDIIIAVMGPTGSGKSTFINIITGFEIANVGHNLGSCTKEVEKFRHPLLSLAYGDLVFVDTPGFDDSMPKSDTDVLKVVDNWLKSTYGKDIKLSGLLYFHRISDNRLAGTPLKNLGMFEELCGKNTLQKVVLTTTMWDEVDQETGETREGELISTYWRPMVQRNSTTNRFRRTRESALTIIDPLIDKANIRISALLQQELADMYKKLSSSSRATSQGLFSTMVLLLEQREELLRRIRNEVKRGAGDQMTIWEPLQDEYQKLKINMESTINDMRRLKIPLGKRLVKMID